MSSWGGGARFEWLDRVVPRGLQAEEKLSRRTAWLLGIVLCLGAILRFTNLSQSIWFDEADTVQDVGGSLAHLVSAVAHHELNPPLYFICVWAWRHLFGSSAADMRTMSALLGTLTIPVAFMVTDRIAGRRPAIVMAALFALSPTMLYYSQELRPYALLMLFCAGGLLAFLTVIQRPTVGRLAAWAALSALALATQYYAALAIVPQAMIMLARSWPDARSRRLTAFAIGVVACAALPLGFLLVYQYSRAYHVVQSQISSSLVTVQFSDHVAVPIPVTAAQIARDLLVGPGGPAKLVLTTVVLLLMMISLYLVRARDSDHAAAGAEFALLLAVPGVTVMAILLLVHRPVQGRYLLPIWLPAMIPVACGFGSRRAGRWGIVAAAGLCLLWVTIGIVAATVPGLNSREDTRGAARGLGVAAANRLIAISQAWDVLPLRLYRPRAVPYDGPTAQITELDVVAMPTRGFPSGSDAPRPAPPRLPGLPRKLVLRAVTRGGTYVIEHFRSSSPVALRLDPSAGVFRANWRFLVEPAGAKASGL